MQLHPAAKRCCGAMAAIKAAAVSPSPLLPPRLPPRTPIAATLVSSLQEPPAAACLSERWFPALMLLLQPGRGDSRPADSCIPRIHKYSAWQRAEPTPTMTKTMCVVRLVLFWIRLDLTNWGSKVTATGSEFVPGNGLNNLDRGLASLVTNPVTIGYT